jgi:dTDP-glucose 4,6-dehydratase
MAGPAVSGGDVTPGDFGLPLDELDSGLERAGGDLQALEGATVLVTGGTGFLGSWLVASLLRAEVRLRLGLRVVVLSRAPELVPLPERSGLEIVGGDVRRLPDLGSVDLVVHGAASSGARFGEGDGEPRAMAATILDGTRAVIELASRTRARLLLLSSGAVYGPQLAPVGEDAGGGPDPMDPRSAYGEAKRMAETLSAAASAAGDVEAIVARLFAFVGPRLPLDAHFAAGNFLADALAGRPVEVGGDGTPRRSYLYTGDLPEWCWALLVRGRPGRAYNVGSPEPVTIGDLATRIAALADPAVEVVIRGTGNRETSTAPTWYVPSTERAESELGLRPRVELGEALRRTFSWFRSRA